MVQQCAPAQEGEGTCIASGSPSSSRSGAWPPLACLAPAAGAQTRAGTTRLVDQALSGLGGRSAVTGLRTFRLQTTGRTWIFDEGLRPDDEVTPASTFTQTLNVELRAAGDRLRADSVRTSQGAARTVSEVLKGRLGYISRRRRQRRPPGHHGDELGPLGGRPPRAAPAQPAAPPARRHPPARARDDRAADDAPRPAAPPARHQRRRRADPAVRRLAHGADRPPVDRGPPVPAPRRPPDRGLLAAGAPCARHAEGRGSASRARPRSASTAR